jgi:hypothetical protein
VSPNLLGANSSSPTAGILNDYGDVSPRIGFAYSLNRDNFMMRNLVIRGGFGISYFPANSGTPGGLHEFELLNAPFQWSAACGVGYADCGPANNFMTAAQYTAQPYGMTNGEYNLQYGLPLAQYQMNMATDPSQYTASLGSDVFIQPNYKPSYLEQYNLQVQKQVGNNIVTAGFIGNLGRRMDALQNLNQPISYDNYKAGIYPMYSAGTPWMDNVTVATVISGGNTAWTAGEATYERRLTSGLSMNVNYTWARSKTQGAGTAPSECVLYGCPMDNGSGTPVLINGWKQWNYDGSTSHRAAGTVSYNLPFGKNLHGIAGAAVKGWALNGTGNWNTGAWGKVSASGDQSGAQNYAVLSNNGSASEYPNLVPGQPAKPHNQSLSNWVNPAAFSLQTSHLLGNGNKSTVQGPRTRDADLSLGKTFSLLEGFKLQFRAESFNFTNTPNYSVSSGGGGGPGGGGALSISQFSCPSGASTGLSVLAGPPPGGGGGPTCPAGSIASKANGFGTINSVSSQPRVFQFGLKLLY